MRPAESMPLHIKQYSISPELYQKGYRGGRGPCTCTSLCCRDGVYADVTERDRILAHREIIAREMDETQTKDESLWFEQQEEEDADFDSGRCVGTQVVNGKCAFLDSFGRCSIQVAAAEGGMPRWALKPKFCILFPLEISNAILRFDDLLDEDQACCSIHSEFDVPLFRACKDELIHVLGEDGYGELERFTQDRKPSCTPDPHQNEVV